MLPDIVTTLKDKLVPQLFNNSYYIFLVGGNGKSNKKVKRNEFREEIIAKQYGKPFEVYYPEDIFDELLSTGKNFNLLTLENLLASSVHAIVIILESPGAIAELGAFANHEELCNKLVVVVDKKYKNKNSFINLGPLRYLHNETKSIVMYDTIATNNIRTITGKIKKAVRTIAHNVKLDDSANNLIFTQNILLVAIYILGEATIVELKDIIEKSGIQDYQENKTLLHSSIGVLLRNEYLSLNVGKYVLTKEGTSRFMSLVYSLKNSSEMYMYLDKLRLYVLNHKFRRNSKKRRMREGVV